MVNKKKQIPVTLLQVISEQAKLLFLITFLQTKRDTR